MPLGALRSLLRQRRLRVRNAQGRASPRLAARSTRADLQRMWRVLVERLPLVRLLIVVVLGLDRGRAYIIYLYTLVMLLIYCLRVFVCFTVVRFIEMLRVCVSLYS